jgi:hypothetical protein
MQTSKSKVGVLRGGENLEFSGKTLFNVQQKKAERHQNFTVALFMFARNEFYRELVGTSHSRLPTR